MLIRFISRVSFLQSALVLILLVEPFPGRTSSGSVRWASSSLHCSVQLREFHGFGPRNLQPSPGFNHLSAEAIGHADERLKGRDSGTPDGDMSIFFSSLLWLTVYGTLWLCLSVFEASITSSLREMLENLHEILPQN